MKSKYIDVDPTMRDTAKAACVANPPALPTTIMLSRASSAAMRLSVPLGRYSRCLSTTTAPHARVHLEERFFGHPGAGDTTLVEIGKELRASVFRYSTGVCGVRVQSTCGEVELLPYQGQAIWRASFLGLDLTMNSMFPEPVPVSPNKQWGYIDTCTCTFVCICTMPCGEWRGEGRCGASMHAHLLDRGCTQTVRSCFIVAPWLWAVRVLMTRTSCMVSYPTPRIRKRGWRRARTSMDSSSACAYHEGDGLCLACLPPHSRPMHCCHGCRSGHYDHVSAFSHHYRATPVVKVYANRTMLPISLTIENRYHKPMDLMVRPHCVCLVP